MTVKDKMEKMQPTRWKRVERDSYHVNLSLARNVKHYPKKFPRVTKLIQEGNSAELTVVVPFRHIGRATGARSQEPDILASLLTN